MCGITLKAMRLGNFFVLHVLQRIERLGLAVELVHAVLAGAGHGLVGGDDDALDRGAVVQRLQSHDELGGRAVRVGDDALLAVARRASAFTSGTTSGTSESYRQADELSITIAPCARDLRRPFLRDFAAGRHEAEIDVGEIVGVEGLASSASCRRRKLPSPGCGGRPAPPPHRPGRRRSARMLSISRPTLPVAPTTATLITHWTSPVALSPEYKEPCSGVASRPEGERTGDDEAYAARFHGRRDGFRFARRVSEQRHCHRPSKSPVRLRLPPETHQRHAFVKHFLGCTEHSIARQHISREIEPVEDLVHPLRSEAFVESLRPGVGAIGGQIDAGEAQGSGMVGEPSHERRLRRPALVHDSPRKAPSRTEGP